MALVLKFKGSDLDKSLGRMSEKLGAVILMYSATKAEQIKAKMKNNRPWTDRTGAAKALLNTKVSRPSPTIVRITLVHGVDYGIWLELANEKNYAIIAPTVRDEGPKVIKELGDIMKMLKM